MLSSPGALSVRFRSRNRPRRWPPGDTLGVISVGPQSSKVWVGINSNIGSEAIKTSFFVKNKKNIGVTDRAKRKGWY